MDVSLFCIATGSTGNAYLLQIGEDKVLLEAGVPLGLVRKANRNRVSDIKAVFVTHEHADHFKYAAAYAKQMALPVYIPSGFFQQDVKILSRQLYPLSTWRRLPGTQISFKAEAQEHDAPTVGLSFRAGDTIIHYVTDSRAIHISPDTEQGKAFWIVECNYTEQRMRRLENEESYSLAMRNVRTRDTHLSDKALAEYFSEHKADGVLLVHTSAENFDPKEFAEVWGGRAPYLVAKAGRMYVFGDGGVREKCNRSE